MPFDGGEWWPGEPIGVRHQWQPLLCRILLAAILLLGAYGLARAQTGQPNNCSGTVGTNAAAIAFPATGSTGPSFPTQYVMIVNPSASATLWLNVTPGGTAAANAAGSFPLVGTGNSVVLDNPAPATISIIASASSTPYTCFYK